MVGYTSVGAGSSVVPVRLTADRKSRCIVLSARLRNLIGSFAETQAKEHAGQSEFADKEYENHHQDVDGGELSIRPHRNRRQKRLGDLIKPERHAAYGQTEPTLEERRHAVSRHRGRADERAR